MIKMSTFYLAAKKVLAWMFDFTGINELLFCTLNHKTQNQYVRAINYHEVTTKDMALFESHLKYYKRRFRNCDMEYLKRVLDGKRVSQRKPGILISFDDGFKDNYDNALPLLEKYGFTGWFMVSSELTGGTYMTVENLRDLIRRGHIVGCHTATHHRMNKNDTAQILTKEIVNAKKELEESTSHSIGIFAWCGGEKGAYTKKAYRYISEAGYQYVFMTDSYPILPGCNPHHLQRTNIQVYWPLWLVRFQLSGFMDIVYRKKRLEEEGIATV